MPQFYMLFYAEYTILVIKKGKAWHHGPSLNTPLGPIRKAGVENFLKVSIKVVNIQTDYCNCLTY